MATIRDIGLKIKLFWGRVRENIELVFIVVLVALLSFALGRLSVLYTEKGEFKIMYPDGQSASVLQGAVGVGGGYVGSRTGGTYFFPWCPLARSIKSENKVYFGSRTEAEQAGYRPGNCNGLKQ